MSIDIRITGTANMGQVASELKKVQAQTAMLSKNFADANRQLGAGGSSGALQNQIRNYRQWGVAMNGVRDDMIAVTRANGEFQTSSMKVGKHVDYLTERIQKQQMGFREARREAKALGDVYRHQLALQKSSAVTWGQTMAGSSKVDLFTPNLGKQSASVDAARKKMGFYGEVLGSVSKKTIDWGKNTQWAGRQLMSGFTYPMTIAAGLAAKYAYDIDKGLTQIVKVYGDAGTAMSETDEQIKKQAMDTAKYLTQFGQSAQDTLEIQSQLASTGKTGKELQESTKQVTKARLLGELNIQDAMKATINLQEVYGMSSEELGDAFNYMNRMENETSLTMQDFVEGIPKVSGIMKTLGADLQDTGILFAAMKTAGIEAKEGGNAIKSMVFKDLAPTPQAVKKFADLTGKNLMDLVAKTKGKPVEMLQEIGYAIEDLTRVEKIDLFGKVFGIHQGGKAITMVEQLTKSTGQMGTAFDIAGASASENAAVAQRELRTLREADWVKAKKAIEDVKLALADFGKVVLKEATPAIQAIANFLKKTGEWFSTQSGGTKKLMLWVGAIVAAAGPTIMLTGLFVNLIGQLKAGGAWFFRLVGNMQLYTTKQKLTQLANQKTARSVDSLSSANSRLASSFDVLNKKAYHNLNPGVASKATVDSLARQNAAKQGSAVGAGSMGVAMYGAGAGTRGAPARPGGIVIDKASVANSNKIMENTKKTQRSWETIGTKTNSLMLAAGMAGTMATQSDSAANNFSNMLLTAALLGPALRPVGGIITSAFTGSAMSKAMTTFKTKLIYAGNAAMLAFDRRVLQSAKKASSAMGSALATGGVAGASTGGVVAGGKKGAGKAGGRLAVAKSAALGLGSSIAAAGPILATGAVAVGAYYYAFHKGAKEAKERQDALNGSVKGLGEMLGFATSETEKFQTGSKKNTSAQYQALADQYVKNNDKFKEAISEMSSTERSVKGAIDQGILKAQEGMVKYGWNKEEAMEFARVYATAVNGEVAYGINKNITIDPFVKVGKVKVEQIERIDKAMKEAFDKDKLTGNASINGNRERRGWFVNNSDQKDEHGVRHGPIVESTKLTGEGKAEMKKNITAAWDVFKNTEGAERKKAFNLMGKGVYTNLNTVYKDLSDKQKKVLEKEGVVDTATFAKYVDKNGPQAVVDLLEKKGAKMTPKAQKNFGEAVQLINEAIIQLLMKSRSKTRKEIEQEYGKEPIVDFDILAGTKGMKAGGGVGDGLKNTIAENKKVFAQYRAEMDLARAARSALTGAEKDAAAAAYMKEYGDIEGMMRYTNEMALAEQKRRDLTKAELEAAITKSFSKKAKSPQELITNLSKMKDEIDKSTVSTKKLSAEEELNRLNQQRRKAGLKETGNVLDGMNQKVTKSAKELKRDTDATNKNTDAKNKNAKAGSGRNIMAGGADEEFRIVNPSKEEAQAAVEQYKQVWERVTDEMFEMHSENLERQHTEALDRIDRDSEARERQIDARQERGEAEFERRQEALNESWERSDEQFQAKWDRTMENFDTKWDNKNEKFDKRWDRTMENFDAKWDAKNEKFESKWEKTMEAFDKKWDAKSERFDAKWDGVMEKFDARWDGKMERFDDKWDKINEQFDARWDKTMENFDEKWERKSEKFEKKWDKTMENFDKRSEKAKKAVEAQFDARIKKIDDAIAAEQKAEEIRQKIFEKEKARITHLANLSNMSINIDVALNTGNLDEAARLSNDAQSSMDEWEVDDAAEESQSGSERKISGLEGRKEKVQKSKDLAIRRIEERIEAERKALEESRKIARKAFEDAQKKERKILEAQRTRERKSLDAQREAQRKSLESQRASQRKALESRRAHERKMLDAARERNRKVLENQQKTDQKLMEKQRERQRKSLESQREFQKKQMDAQRELQRNQLESQRKSQERRRESHKKATQKRLDRERAIFDKELEKARKTNKDITENKRRHENSRYEKAKKSLEKEMEALKAFVPRNRKELKDHMDKLGRSYNKFGYKMEKKGDDWSKEIGNSLEHHIRVARNEMSSSDKWDKLGKTVAGRMTRGAFDMNVNQFMKWVGAGGKGSFSSSKKAKKSLPKQAAKRNRSLMDKAVSRHKGGIIDGTKGSRVGHSGKYQSQSEVTVNALKGEAVINRKGTKALGKSGIDAINSGKVTSAPKSRNARVKDDQSHERGDSAPKLGLSGIAGMFASQIATMAMGHAVKAKGEEQQEKEAAMDGGAFSGSNFEAFWKALGIQESGGNYKAVNRDSGALGKYQVMPANVNRWAQMFLGRSMSPSAFLNSPKLQDQLVKAALGSMYKKHGPRGAAAEWYSGQPGLHMSTRAQPGGPSIKGYVDGVISKMNKLIGSRNAGGGGGLPPRTPSGAYKVWPGMGWKKQWAIVHRRWPRRGHPEPNQINRGGHVKNSYHYRNRAIDLGSAKANGDSMMSLFNWLYKNYGRQSTQIIYGRARSRNILNGRHHNYGAGTAAAHMGHIHWAMKNGGIVPGQGVGDKTPIMGEPGEFMVRKKAVDKIGPDFLKALNSDKFVNMPNKAISNAGSSAGAAEGAGSVDNSYSPVYNINIDAKGNKNPDDIGKAVEDALTNIERRKGFNRRIGTK